ncbi:MAG: regulatory protein RecX [Anaerolineales bacterium]
MTKTVTAMVPRAKKRVQIYLDDQHGFTLSKKIAKEVRLAEKLDNDRIRELIERDRQEVAYEQALRLLSYRPRTERELRMRFGKSGLPDQVQDAAVERLKAEGLVDDAAFAEIWIDNRMEFRPRAAWALRSELSLKGVARELIEVALEDFDEGEAARRAAAEGARRYRHLSPDLFRRRLSAYLSRRGFTYSTISPLVAQHLAETEAESEGSH